MSRGSDKPLRRSTGRSPDHRVHYASESALAADQLASDADQISADRDEAAAAHDQHAADLDQSTVDIHNSGGAGREPEAAFEASRATRASSAISRAGTRAARAMTKLLRVETASERAELAASRDEKARRRDARANAIDRSIVASDAPLDEKLDKVLTRAEAARARAAVDRKLAARDRADDAYERSSLLAQRDALEEQLRQAQKMEGIGRLASGIAHDFNNLLTAIRGNASLALAELPPNHKAREDVEQIEQAADRATALTRQLLAFARRTILQPEVVDLSAVVRRLVPMLRRLIGEDIDLITIAPEATRSVLADPSQIEQVIVNLVVNASDAMPEGGTLTIEISAYEPAAEQRSNGAEDLGPMTALAVADTGVGMDSETAQHVFEPFFTTKEPGTGTGLGLASVYGIVHQSGGRVTVVTDKGRGSRFTVYLPCANAAAVASAEQESPGRAPTSRSAGGTILVVEDDHSVRRFVGRALETAGYSVSTAPDGAAAIEVSRHMQLALLLTDVVMPGMSGPEVAVRLSAAHAGLRVLYISGHPDKGAVGDSLMGAQLDFLAKPFTADALLAAVERSIAPAPDRP